MKGKEAEVDGVEMDGGDSASPLHYTAMRNHASDKQLFYGFMTHLNPLFALGSRRTLEIEDCGTSHPDMQVKRNFGDFSTEWEHQITKDPSKRSFWAPFFKVCGYRDPIIAAIFQGFSAASVFAGPMILKALTQHMAYQERLNPKILWTLVSLLFVAPVLGSVCNSQSGVMFTEMGFKVRNALVSLIFRKAMEISPSARSMSSGQITNIFSNDTLQIQTSFLSIGTCLFSPAQVIIALALIYQEVGVSMFVAFGYLIAVLPIIVFIASYFQYYVARKLKQADKRIKLTNEVMTGIRIIKYYAWELPFRAKLEDIRSAELAESKKIYYVWIGLEFFLNTLPIVQPILIFYSYIRLGNSLTYSTAFTTLSLFFLIQQPISQIPTLLNSIGYVLVSAKRILKILNMKDITRYIGVIPDEDTNYVVDGKKTMISIEGADLGWISEIEVEGLDVDDGKNSGSKKGSKESSKKSPKESSKEKCPEEEPVGSPKGESADKATGARDGFVDLEVGDGEKDKGDKGEGDVAEPMKKYRATHTLVDINLRVQKHQLVAIVGTVGGGKSSLLSAILGEMVLNSGAVKVRGSVAYHQQQPWILNATIRENILFGESYNEARFQYVLHAAALDVDIASFPAGVDTEIGERGITLSGGQKARVSFARALYKNADTLLLDDPLSAVDSHTGAHLFFKGMKPAVKEHGKTIILVTHQVHVLPHCDVVVVIEDGKIAAMGSYAELEAAKINFHADEYEKDESDDEVESHNSYESYAEGKHNDDEPVPDMYGGTWASRNDRLESEDRDRHSTDDSEACTQTLTAEAIASLTAGSQKDQFGVAHSDVVNLSDVVAVGSDGSQPAQLVELMPSQSIDKAIPAPAAPLVTAKPKAKGLTEDSGKSLMTLEDREVGAVDSNVYMYYLVSGGWYIFVFLLIISLCGKAATLFATFWLGFWGKENVDAIIAGTELSVNRNLYYLNIYAALSLCNVVAATGRAYLASIHGIRTGHVIHNAMLKQIVGASVSFFDTTPLGRILNRFSADIGQVDQGMAALMSLVMNLFVEFFGNLVGIAVTTSGTFLVLVVPLVVIYYQIQSHYRKTNTELKRISSIARSPIFTQFSSTLSGVAVIRAFGQGPRFIERMDTYIDAYSAVFYVQSILRFWLAIRLDALGGCIAFFVAALAVSTNDFISPEEVAIALSFSFTIPVILATLMTLLAEIEATMSSLERVKYFTENAPLEEDEFAEEFDALPKGWPSEGKIVVQNLSMRYRDGPLILKDLTFSTKPREKVGICGRTGSGKSSLMVALFRIETPAQGTVEIDGVDVSTIPLAALRSSLGLIPQEPVMFSSSLRFNIDPFSKHTDEELWDVLGSVGLKPTVEELKLGLEETVEEGGENFSMGQRQLICFARALLRSPKIVLLDEATASVDNETDTLIQRMIRERFADKTVLTIAHRLNTILDSDRVLCLDDGALVEYDNPNTLLEKDGGAFRGMWDKAQQARHATH